MHGHQSSDAEHHDDDVDRLDDVDLSRYKERDSRDDKFLGIIDADDLQQTGTAIAAIAGGVLIIDVIAMTLTLLAKRRNGHDVE